jgi:nucleotide-binding universal stress UspA family protein
MTNIRSILFATDLYLTGDEVGAVAGRLSQVFGAKVYLLHVVKRHTDLHLAEFPLIEQASARLTARKNQLDASGGEVVALPVQIGAPQDVIVKQAERLDVDLILMGCGRHLADSGSVAGSIAEGVIQHARQPVLAVFPGAAPDVFRQILCPVDHSPTSKRGLRNAIRLAQALGSKLAVLSVIPDVNWLEAAIQAGEFRYAVEQHDLRWGKDFEDFVKGVSFAEVPWHPILRSGIPADQIVEAATDGNYGLIVMGATGRSGVVRRLLGSVTRDVLRRLPCSILVVKDEDLIEEFTEEDAKVVELLFAEGESLMGVASFEAAVAKFDQVLAHNPFHVPTLQRRADALQQLGLNDRSERSRRRAAALQRIS